MPRIRSHLAVYLASPLGFAESTRAYVELVVTRLENIGLHVHNPWTFPESAAAALAIQEAEQLTVREWRQSALREANGRIAAANERAIRTVSLMVAVLDGADVESGTASEVGFAAALGHRIYGLRTDWRRSPENDGALVNLQLQWWIDQSGGRIVASLEELELHLRQHLKEMSGA